MVLLKCCIRRIKVCKMVLALKVPMGNIHSKKRLLEARFTQQVPANPRLGSQDHNELEVELTGRMAWDQDTAIDGTCLLDMWVGGRLEGNQHQGTLDLYAVPIPQLEVYSVLAQLQPSRV